VRIVLGHEVIDLGYQVLDAAKTAPANSPLGDDVEPDLDLVEPGTIRGRVVHMKARTRGQPASHFLVFVGGVVVDHPMKVQSFGHLSVDQLEELEKLLMPMARHATGQHLSGDDVQGRIQSGSAMAGVIVRNALDIPQAQGQHRLRAFQRLDLAFFIDAQEWPCRADSNTTRQCSAPFPQKKGRRTV